MLNCLSMQAPLPIGLLLLAVLASGPRPARPQASVDTTAELILQRTLSVFQEGNRYPDFRRVGKLAQLGTTAQDVAAGFTVAPCIVLPQGECDSRARGGLAAERSCPGGPQ